MIKLKLELIVEGDFLDDDSLQRFVVGCSDSLMKILGDTNDRAFIGGVNQEKLEEL